MKAKGQIGETNSAHSHGVPTVDLPAAVFDQKPFSSGDWVAVYLPGEEERAVPALLCGDSIRQGDDATFKLDLPLRTVLGVGCRQDGPAAGVVSVAAIGQTRRGRWSQQPKRSLSGWLWLRRFIDRIMPTSAVLCEVHKVPVHLAEQNVALLDQSSMQILGLSPGDEAVLTSVAPMGTSADSQEFVRIIKIVKAYVHSEGRKNKAVPQIKLPEALRTQLGLDIGYFDGHSLAPEHTAVPSVLVAPSRGYALTDNLREAALVISLGAFGIAVSLTDSPPTLRWSIALAGGVLLPLALIFWRVRTKLR